MQTNLQGNLAQMSASPLETLLAQADQQVHTPHTCSFAQDRAKADLEDFYTILAAGQPFTDSTFTMEDAFYLAEDAAGTPYARNRFQYYYTNKQWKRAYDALPGATLFGKDGVHFQDINQGSLGNCWVLASTSAIAEIPSRLDSVIVNQDNALNPAGIYAFNFRTLGFPHTVIVDDYLPM